MFLLLLRHYQRYIYIYTGRYICKYKIAFWSSTHACPSITVTAAADIIDGIIYEYILSVAAVTYVLEHACELF
jgi:hypothetical protein